MFFKFITQAANRTSITYNLFNIKVIKIKKILLDFLFYYKSNGYIFIIIQIKLIEL